MFLYRNGRIAESGKAFESAVGLEPTDPMLNYLSAELMRLEKKFDKAEVYIKNALKLSPGNMTYMQTLARVLIGAKKFTEGSKVIKKLLEKDGRDPVNRQILLEYQTGQ